MSEPVWRERYRIRTSEADMNGMARLDALFCCFQEAADHHASDLGVGRDDLHRRECFWVLSRCWMQVDHFPVLGQPITVRTWPRGVERLFALRDFQFLSENNEILGFGSSAWLILDQDKHRPVKPGPFLQDIATNQESAVSAVNCDLLEKQIEPHDLSRLRTFSVRYSDLDVNRHTNNAAYVRWVLDSFDAQRHDSFRITSIRIDYLSETVLGDRIAVEAQPIESDGSQGVLGVRHESGKPVFQARIHWLARS